MKITAPGKTEPAPRPSSAKSLMKDLRPQAQTLQAQQALAAASPKSARLQTLQALSAARGDAPIQRYAIGSGSNRIVTLTGKNNKTRSFQECHYNYVEYKKGDQRGSGGTGTQNPAAWATWLVNQSNGNNATQLHVVNQRWGGLGGRTQGNIVPGTPAENSHHLHEGEKVFDATCFGHTGPSATDKAIQDAKYETYATPSYGSAVDVSGGPIDVADPTLTVVITTATGSKSGTISAGGGLRLKEGS